MSNLFKQNSRFAALVEDNPQPQKKEKKSLTQASELKSDNKEKSFNAFKNENPDNDIFNSFKGIEKEPRFRRYNQIESDNARHERLAQESNRKLREKQEKERLEQENLKPNNFPQLKNIKKNTKIKKTNQINYIEKITQTTSNNNTFNINNFQDPHIIDLKPGWVILKRNTKTIINSHSSTPFLEKPEIDISRDTLKSLVDLHEKRTKEYIDTYGEYNWEKIFKRPMWREEIMSDSDDFDEEEYDEDKYEEEEYDGY